MKRPIDRALLTTVRAPLWILVLLTLSGTLAMHMFVPALAAASIDLHTTPVAIQSTISLYIFGLAIGQLIYGPISDAYGRRPTLLLGLSIFTIGSIACIVATTVQFLVIARFVQALGGCAGLLLGRAIVKDTSNKENTMSRLATLQLIAVAGPALAPMIGSLITVSLGWRWIFVVFVLLGLIGLTLVWRVLPETRPPSPAGTRRPVRVEYLQLVRTRAFLGCVIGGGCSTSAFYAFIASAPFIFVNHFHQKVTTVGVNLFILVIGISFGYSISGRLAGKVSVSKLIVCANALTVLCSASMLIELLFFRATAHGIVITMFVYCVGAGMCSPVAVTKAMSIVPSVAGSASGIFGFGQMTIGALCTALAGLGHDRAISSAAVLLAAALIGQMGFWVTLHDTRTAAARPVRS